MTSKPAFTQTKSLYFDGVDDYITLSNQGTTAELLSPQPDEAFSVSMWLFYHGTNATATMWSMRTSGRGFACNIQGGNIRFGAYTGSSMTNYVETHYHPGYAYGWVHLVCTYSGNSNTSGLNIYIDNSYDIRGTTLGTSISANFGSGSAVATAFVLGTDGDYPTPDFKGNICNVSYWDKELSGAEVAEIYYGRDGSRGCGDLRRHSANANLRAWWLADDPADEITGVGAGTIKNRANNPATPSDYDFDSINQFTTASFVNASP